MDLLDGLNPAQSEAVQTTSGPLLILAGAGSGKTKTLTHRIAYLIAHESIWPDNILAVTFTNKAAREMRERLGLLLGQNSENRGFMPWMGTFHGICVRLLRIEGEAIGLPRNFVIYDEDDRQGLIKQAMKQLQIGDNEIKAKTVSGLISSAKNEMVGPDEYESTAQFPYQKNIAKIYKKYELLRKNAGALDFDDLLLEAVRLLRDVPAVRTKWQTKFKHILIDEYQDTNAAQYNIIKLLVNDSRNICVVGDDWQSIYSWRGADFTNILNFERDFKGTKVIKLEQNYRSTGNILDAASSVITKNIHRTDKKLWTAAGPGAPVQVHELFDESEEARLVAERVASHVAMGARKFGDFAVLYRTNAQSYTLERSFLQLHIPYQIVGGVRFYDRKEIKDIIAYLRLIYQPQDRMSFSRIVNVPVRGVGAMSLEKFLIWQSENDMDIITALANVNQTSTITARAKSALLTLGEKLRIVQSMIDTYSPIELIEKILSLTGYMDYIKDGTPQVEDREENIGSLLSDAQTFASLPDFLEEVALMSSADNSIDGQKVTLMTLHAAKGLEFPVVFIVGMEEGILPHARVYEAGLAELEEERRLAYVGMTRAREELHLTYAQNRMQFGQRSYNPMSRFIADIGDQVALSSPAEPRIVPEQEFYSDELFIIGEHVQSATFGNGEIVEVDGLAITIKFDNGTTKKLNAEYARLKKI
ncbi:ATP-dependent DNA helicase PcrA [Candidatus Saccharibacteria bacterium CG11_big_fil_rev_8_21_14_0_20_41_19]|nr:UvrD-helicase domain-containing protein [Candidatus Saccharibacteria bacterium]OIP85996.1 MAG: ATP-dependent DNA helicase PcrA [Candidatus Saccharibacteria bacterium CG2_30_41_52]PIQ70815.1 MAG: ATP-dependent DNA helicase PcrA [Candidatus Saccharibacteria bacterium CG11_big_fil_rev_8_21_14_0_20_41_19]PIZ60102.1 MAG: ATP-dependent DNA helicase PcrA [Candidatus Saccharibacteria bacterium CG_4_10_14_0_2_um_filter_41_11]PJC29549.1 MAG: ATP-dependent DNA helicase PcrA [Candidatus Saccharibacteria